MDHESELNYVVELFNVATTHNEKYGIRNKGDHTRRTLCWAERLLKTESADRDQVLSATIFHDSGYTIDETCHSRHSAEICLEYMNEKSYEKKFAQAVIKLILNHEDKSLLKEENTSIEQKIVIEADCLDETGALSELRDAVAEAENGTMRYSVILDRLCDRSILRGRQHWYCVTKTAERIWSEKYELCRKFIDSMRIDLNH